MKKLIFLFIILPFLFCNCSKDDPITEDPEIENPQDSTDTEIINNPNDTITQNIIFVFNHVDYVYNSYNNDFMSFDISSCSIGTQEKWVSEYSSSGSVIQKQDGYTSQVVFYATGSRITKDQYNKLHSGFIDIQLIINISHQDSTIYGEYNVGNNSIYADERIEGNMTGQLQTWFFYTDPSDKGTFSGGHFDFAPETKMTIMKSKDKGYFTLVIDNGDVYYDYTRVEPLSSKENIFNVNVRYKGEYKN